MSSSVAGDGAAVLVPAVRARTVLAACHEAWVVHRDMGTPPLPFAVVDVVGVPHLVLGPAQVLEPGTVEVRLGAVAQRLGTLVIDGRLGPRRSGMSDGAVWRVLREHETCMTEPGRGWALPQVSVMAVAPSRIRLSEPGSEPGPQQAVDPVEFRAAVADAWALHGAEMIAHLESHHQTELCELVRRTVGVSATAVAVRSLGRTGGVLTAMSEDGVRDVVLRFAPEALTPEHGMARLRASAGRGPS
jgi:hypothetical protein